MFLQYSSFKHEQNELVGICERYEFQRKGNSKGKENNINSNGMSFNSMNNILVDPTGMES